MPESSSGESLVSLILAMSKAERRYFHILCRNSPSGLQSNAFRLYQHLLRTQQWNENAIRLEFEGEAFLRQLNVLRTALWEQLLDALRNFDQGKSPQLDFSRRLDHIELLIRRKHFHPAMQLAKVAQRRAAAIQNVDEEIRVIRWQMRILRLLRPNTYSSGMRLCHQRISLLARQLEEEVQLTGILDEVLALLSTTAHSPEQLRLAADQIRERSLLQRDPSTLPFDSRLIYTYVLSYLGYLDGDMETYRNQQEAIAHIWESLPERIRLEPERYFRVLAGLAEGSVQAGTIGLAQRTIAKMDRLLARWHDVLPTERLRIFHLKLSLFHESNDFLAAHEVSLQVRALLAQHSAAIPYALQGPVITNALTACLVLQRWTETSQWAHDILDTPPLTQQPLWHATATTALCIALYELHDHHTLERLLKTGLNRISEDLKPQLLSLFTALLQANSSQEETAATDKATLWLTTLGTLRSLPHNTLFTWITSRHPNPKP